MREVYKKMFIQGKGNSQQSEIVLTREVKRNAAQLLHTPRQFYAAIGTFGLCVLL